MGNKKPQVFFVDDEPQVCKAVKAALGKKYDVQCFGSAQECLAALDTWTCDLLITDVNMPEVDGIELVVRARRRNPVLPALVVTGYGDIPMAVRAIRAGAADFIEKPLDREILLGLIDAILRQSDAIDPLVGQKLTSAERIVLRLILEGRSNRQIAKVLHRSVRTIEDHRSHIMRKLEVRNVAELVRVALKMDD